MSAASKACQQLVNIVLAKHCTRKASAPGQNDGSEELLEKTHPLCSTIQEGEKEREPRRAELVAKAGWV
jgi:predicted GNAT family acetyltransferase